VFLSIVTNQPTGNLMSVIRRFRVASSLARLISLDREGSRVAEGYFTPGAEQSLRVRLQESTGQLILSPSDQEGSGEQAAEIPLSQAEALLAVTAGQVGYEQSTLPVGSHEARLMRFVTPGGLDLITVEFASPEQAQLFEPPEWFGPEVTQDRAYETRAIALEGIPAEPEVALTDAALHSLLDALEGQPASEQPQAGNAGDAAQISSQELVQEGSPAAEEEGRALDLQIEDNVIRELARSLRPLRRWPDNPQS
jgi:CYTH domain-containing protein